MPRTTFLAWGDDTDVKNVDAAEKALTTSYQDGLIIPVPHSVRSIGLNFLVATTGGASEILMKVFNSHNSTDWAISSAMDGGVVSAPEIQIPALDMVIKVTGIADGYGKQIRIGTDNSDFIKLALKADAGTPAIKVLAVVYQNED